MKRNIRKLACVAIVALGVRAALAQVTLDEEFGREASWKSPSAAEVRTQVLAWVNERKPDEKTLQQVHAWWPEVTKPADGTVGPEALRPVNVPNPANEPAALFERVVETIALVDSTTKPIVDLCSKPHSALKTPEFSSLADEKTSAFVRNNLRLWLGRWLAQERLYDEAMAQLKDLQAENVVDPGALLFYQSVCHHWMLHKEDGLKSIAKLLEQRKTIPRRYEQMADLMQADLSALEDESLDHISRRMNDVTRRLDFGHAGKKVRGVEDGIVASLDKLIKELEDKANSSSSSSQGEGDGQRESRPGGNQGNPDGIRSQSPANESRLAKGKGKGEVKSKNIGNKSGWGDLPEKEREAAMQQITREFPSHYREVIEQYFRKLASDEEQK
jgi:hypothetical protein